MAALLIAGLLAVSALGAAVTGLQRPDATPSPAPTAVVSIATLTPTATPASTRTPTPNPTPWPTIRILPTASPTPWEWQPYEVTGFGPNSRVDSVWGLEDRFVAHLTTSIDIDHALHSLLVSADGSAWTRAILPAAGFEVERGRVIDGALWLIGTVALVEGRSRQVWWTRDASAWTRDEAVEGMLEAATVSHDLAHSSAGWVVVYSIMPAVGGYEIRIRRAADGAHLTVPNVPPLDPAWEVIGLETDGTGFVIVVQRSDGPDREVAVVRSADGLDWTLEPVAEGSSIIQSIAYGIGGYVLVGERDGEDEGPVAWRSADGSHWEQVTLPTGHVALGLVVPGAQKVVATNRGYITTARFNGDVWWSTDGIGWTSYKVWQTEWFEHMIDIAVVGDVIVAASGRELDAIEFLRGSVSGAPRP